MDTYLRVTGIASLNSYYCQLITTVTADELSPGLKTILSFKVPDQTSGKVSNMKSIYSLFFSTSRLPFCLDI